MKIGNQTYTKKNQDNSGHSLFEISLSNLAHTITKSKAKFKWWTISKFTICRYKFYHREKKNISEDVQIVSLFKKYKAKQD